MSKAIAVAKSMVGKFEDLREVLPSIIEGPRVRDTIDSSNLITVRYNVFSISTTLMSKERVEKIRDNLEVFCLWVIFIFATGGIVQI